MSVSPVELRSLGERLLITGPDESSLRAGISRCYYACFHACKDLTDDLGIPRESGTGEHVALSNALVTVRRTDFAEQTRLRELGTELHKFKNIRTVADYYIAENIVEDEIEDAKDYTDNIFSNIRALRAQRAANGGGA